MNYICALDVTVIFDDVQEVYWFESVSAVGIEV